MRTKCTFFLTLPNPLYDIMIVSQLICRKARQRIAEMMPLLRKRKRNFVASVAFQRKS